MAKGRPYTPIQSERVLRDIIARGLLSKQELRYCAFVWRLSWGFSRNDTADSDVGTGAAVAFTGMDRRIVRRVRITLEVDGIVKVGESGALEFNEHIETWKRTYSAPPLGGLFSLPLCGRLDHGLISPPAPIQPQGGGLIGPKSAPIQPPPIHIRDIRHKKSTTKKESAPRKSRGPTVPEKRFLDGFKNQYDSDCTIDRDSAIALNLKVTKHGLETVLNRIDRWWTHEAGQWPKGARTIGAFLRSFDALAGTNGPGETPSEQFAREVRERTSD